MRVHHGQRVNPRKPLCAARVAIQVVEPPQRDTAVRGTQRGRGDASATQRVRRRREERWQRREVVGREIAEVGDEVRGVASASGERMSWRSRDRRDRIERTLPTARLREISAR